LDTAALVASVVVAAAFLLAGASKLAAGAQWPSEAAALGAPAGTIPLVPWIELALGALLVTQLAAPWPAIAACFLLVAFSVLIALRLAADEHPPCACFGAWSATPIGWRHLARNAVLLTLAIVAATER
jgi:uncharacterized membrane protein YphA (DoxX/SURF4 family)